MNKPKENHPWRQYKPVDKERRKLSRKFSMKTYTDKLRRNALTRREILQGIKHSYAVCVVKDCHCINCISKRKRNLEYYYAHKRTS